MEPIFDYFRQLSWWQACLLSFGIFLVSFVVSLAVTVWVMIKLPADYFADATSEEWWPEQHPVLRWLLKIAKNLCGVLLIVVGVVLSLPGVPGQGVLTILIGVMLLDFPGKRRLERALVRRPAIFEGINRIRARCGSPPLILDSPAEGAEKN